MGHGFETCITRPFVLESALWAKALVHVRAASDLPVPVDSEVSVQGYGHDGDDDLVVTVFPSYYMAVYEAGGMRTSKGTQCPTRHSGPFVFGS